MSRSHPNSPLRKSIDALPDEGLDGRYYGVYLCRVTTIDDPLKHNRIKVRYHWLEEDDGPVMESGWVNQFTSFAGPTNMARGRVFGMDWPLPEVESLVGVFFDGGDLHRPWYFGQPRYLEDDTGAPRVEKDKHRDWSLRINLQNGFEFGVDTEGNVYLTIPGDLRVKGMCSAFISATSELIMSGTNVELDAKAVLRNRGVTADHIPYPRPDEKSEVRERTIDMYTGPPGREDPGIGTIEDME
jgi:hypothetical protein